LKLIIILVSVPHETKRTLKPEDHKEWVVGNKDRLIVMGKKKWP
jgi:hypothetical protein